VIFRVSLPYFFVRTLFSVLCIELISLYFVMNKKRRINK
jgi:hypothetical protein